MSVIRLVDHAPVAVSDQQELFGWLRDWTDSLASGEFGEFRSMMLVVEGKDGSLATICQALSQIDTARIIGLLTMMAARKANGEGNIMDLRK